MWNIEGVVSCGDYNYAIVKNHPKSTKNGYVLEHRVIMENHINRILDDDEIVHHIDGDKKNNDISNLQLLTRSEHTKLHQLKLGHKVSKFKCPICGKIFKRYGDANSNWCGNKIKCVCCSNNCRGKLSSMFQYHRVTHELEDAISGNLLAEYMEYI